MRLFTTRTFQWVIEIGLVYSLSSLTIGRLFTMSLVPFTFEGPGSGRYERKGKEYLYYVVLQVSFVLKDSFLI